MTDDIIPRGEEGIKDLESKINVLDSARMDEPSAGLNKIYGVLNDLKVPQPTSDEEAKRIIKTGSRIVAKLLEIFGEHYPTVEDFDIVKAQGLKTFMVNLARFSEKLGEVLDMVPKKMEGVFFDTSLLETTKNEILSLIRSGDDIGPKIKNKTANLIKFLENIPQVPKDHESKMQFFEQFSQFSEKMIELLEIMTFIKGTGFSLGLFLEDNVKSFLEPGLEVLETIDRDSSEMLTRTTIKAAMTIYVIGKQATKDVKREFMDGYKRIVREVISKMKNRSEIMKSLKSSIKYNKGRDPLDLLKEYRDDLESVLNLMKRLSRSISDLIHNCIEASGKILNAFVLSANEAYFILEKYRPMFDNIASEMMNFDSVAFSNIINKNKTSFEAISERIIIAREDVSKAVNSVISNRKTLDYLNRFYRVAHEMEGQLDRIKKRLDDAINIGTLKGIMEKLKLTSGEIISAASIVHDFFNRNFKEIYDIYKNMITTLQSLRRKF